jgi:hypothetical protein
MDRTDEDRRVRATALAVAVWSALAAVGFFWTWALSLDHPHLRGEEPAGLVFGAFGMAVWSAVCVYRWARP